MNSIIDNFLYSIDACFIQNNDNLSSYQVNVDGLSNIHRRPMLLIAAISNKPKQFDCLICNNCMSVWKVIAFPYNNNNKLVKN